jgi:peptide/nickel transport system permease protein
MLLTGLTLLVAAAAPLLAPVDPFILAGPALSPPSAAHPFGTDGLGRDVLSGVLYGARTSLLVSGAVGMIALLLGVGTGMIAAYTGGLVDDALTRLAELCQVMPRFFLAIMVVALFGPGIDRIILALGLTSWPVIARVTRTEVMSLREREFVLAAKAAGASPARVMLTELLPNVLPSALVLLGLLLGQVLLVEASLGFLGLGDPNMMSWGMLAGQAQSFLRTAWWLALFPGLAITIAVLGLNLLADALAAAPGGR